MQLSEWCKLNKERGDRLIAEWTGKELNKEDTIKSMSELTHGSGRKFYWICKNCSNEWCIDIHNRTTHSSNCPYCDGKKVNQDVNGLYMYLKDNNKKLLEEWYGEDNAGNKVNILDYTVSSNKKVLWKCSCGNIWSASINHRVNKHSGCPVCSLKEQSRLKMIPDSNDKRLLNWCKSNGKRGKQLLEEWTGILDSGETVDINDISYGSQKRVKWRCKNGHEWFASPYVRTVHHSNCVNCSGVGTSYPERYLFYALKQIYSDTQSRLKVLKNVISGGVEYDIVIKSIKTCIEYSPLSTHNTDKSKQMSIFKKTICDANGYNYIEIIDTNEGSNISYEDNIIKFNYRYDDNKLKTILRMIIGDKINTIDFKEVEINAACNMRYKSSDEIDILSQEWSSLNNLDIHNALDRQKYYWICSVCGYGKNGNWQASFNNRVSKKSGCPMCGSNILKGINNSNRFVKNVYPKLFKEINEINMDIEGLLIGSSKRKVYWKCTKCNYGLDKEWYTEVSTRIRNKTGCPKCGYNCFNSIDNEEET